jgi:MurNAc alpha-1-phosphate uridylyltransferase
MALGAVSGELHQGMWMDIGTMERLQAFDDYLSSRANG